MSVTIAASSCGRGIRLDRTPALGYVRPGLAEVGHEAENYRLDQCSHAVMPEASPFDPDSEKRLS
ncbi:MAG: hypothetical protein ACR2RE_04010 [Geminicoccaceae bacterium]